MNRILCTLLIVFLAYSIKAQESKKGFKQIEKQNYEKAEKIFQEVVMVKSEHSAANYGLSLIYSNDLWPTKDYFKAYDYVQTSLNNYDKMDAKEMKDLAENFNKTMVETAKADIEKKLADFVTKQNRLDVVDQFLEKCSESQYYATVMEYKQKIEFEDAKSQNSIDALNTFIASYPDAKTIGEAKKIRNNLAFNQIKTSNKLDEFNKFIRAYPDAEQLPEAKKLRDAMEYKRVKVINTFEAYNDFLLKYPDAIQAKEATLIRNELAFRQAKTIQTTEAYNDFIKNYPNATQVGEAAKLRDQLATDEVLSQNTPDAYKKFLHQFRNSSGYNQIFNLMTENFGKEVKKEAKFPSDFILWLKAYDFEGKRDKAKKMIQCPDNSLIMAGNTALNEKWLNDIWLVKTDSEGKIIWDKTFGDDLDDGINDIAVNALGEIYITGHLGAKSSNTGNPMVLKLDANGKKIWGKKYPGTDAQSISVAANQDLILTGYNAQVDGNRDFWICRLSPKGDILWSMTFAKKGVAHFATADNTGEIIVVGENWIMKLDQNGALKWEKPFVEGNVAYTGLLNPDGTVIVTGRSYLFTKESRSDFWIAKYDKAGNLTWEKKYDKNNEFDKAYSICKDNTGDLIVAGLTSTNKDTDDDLWILRLDANGNKKEEKLFGTANNEKLPSVVVTSDNRVVILSSSGLESNFILFSF